MEEACTGVIRANPMEETASRIHWDRGGDTESHDLEDIAVTGTQGTPSSRFEMSKMKQKCA